jgi:polar amino acid transport system permease protein
VSIETTIGNDRSEPIKAKPVRRPGRWIAIAVIAVLAAMFVHMLLTNDAFQWAFMFDNMFLPPVIEGLTGTIVLTVSAMLLGVVLGVIVAVMRLSSSWVLSGVAFLYTWFFRAVPRLVLCILFGSLGTLWPTIAIGVPFDTYLGKLFGIDDLELRIANLDANELLSGFLAGLLALGLSEAAYMAEIVRAGVQSIDKGQSEAAGALGMTRRQTLRRIVLPQAMRVIVPPTGNETIAMLKDTSLVAFIPVTAELFFQLQQIGNRTFQVFPMLVAACLWYLALTSVLMVMQYFVERHFARGYGPTQRARQRLRNITAEASGTPPAEETS